MDERLLCKGCGDVIGVYEPLVALKDGHPHETSRINERIGPASGIECYHRDCFARDGDEHGGRHT